MSTLTDLQLAELKLNPIAQPPHGYVRYIDHLGSDERIVQTARHSYDQGSKGEEADRKLLHYLYKHRHTSPFEQCSITFEIKFPIFLMRQFVRHRMFRLNEVSARYTELPEEYFLPESWRVQDTVNKQGSVPFKDGINIPFSDGMTLMNQENITDMANDMYALALAHRSYKFVVEGGVSKEQARMILPVGIYTKIFVNCDLHNLTHFLRLRLDSHAQAEMRDVAAAMFTIAAKLFPWTMEAFNRFQFTVVDLESPEAQEFQAWQAEKAVLLAEIDDQRQKLQVKRDSIRDMFIHSIKEVRAVEQAGHVGLEPEQLWEHVCREEQLRSDEIRRAKQADSE